MHSTAPVSQPSPAHVFVPVRRGGSAVVLRTYVDPLGQRTGVGFTTPDGLREVLGETVEFIELGVNACRALLVATGIHALCLDPRLSATLPVPSQPVAQLDAVPTGAGAPTGSSRGGGTAALRLEGFAA